MELTGGVGVSEVYWGAGRTVGTQGQKGYRGIRGIGGFLEGVGV